MKANCEDSGGTMLVRELHETFKEAVPPQIFESCYPLPPSFPLLTLPGQGAECLDAIIYIKIPRVSYEAPIHLTGSHQTPVDFHVPDIEQ